MIEMNKLMMIPALGLAAQVGCAPKAAQSGANKKMNILFIAVDDMKPNLGIYGDKLAVTPNMDRLGSTGYTFMNCYCQQAVSGPTRASLLTGMRPDKTRVWDLQTDFRQVNPKALSMPEYFKNNGYETVARGKIYHVSSAGPGHDAPSWSLPYDNIEAPNYAKTNVSRGPATEGEDVEDNFFKDGKTTDEGIMLLNQLSKGDKPFFLAIGLLRPHLPFVSPKKYWDLYQRDKFEVAPFQKKAKNSPDVAYHTSSELKSYTDIPMFDSYSENELEHLPKEKQLELLHGYYAATSYTDANIGRLLAELDRLGLAENTIVVVWGDHGWHLGDHGLWNKHTDFEQATHVVMMMRVPGMKQGMKPTTMCEFVDIFPTLCDLNGMNIPSHLDGVSLVPAMKDPDAKLREYALSQYPKQNMGYTIRTERFRYTEWMANNGKEKYTTAQPYDRKNCVAREMYDYKSDPLETKSLIGDPKYRKEQEMMEKLFQQAMEREHHQCMEFAKIADYHPKISTADRK